MIKSDKPPFWPVSGPVWVQLRAINSSSLLQSGQYCQLFSSGDDIRSTSTWYREVLMYLAIFYFYFFNIAFTFQLNS